MRPARGKAAGSRVVAPARLLASPMHISAATPVAATRGGSTEPTTSLAEAAMTTQSDYLALLKIDDEQIRLRRAFFELTDQDLARLAALRPLAEKYTDGVVEDFYKLLLGHARESYESLQRLVFFDMSLAIDTYIAANQATIGRHQAAIRELSTPVIKVFDRVLLLPLIGEVDGPRADQVMESVLKRIVEDQAKVIILDIAGVPVVDTKVADNLVKTTGAVRLLGAVTILTGISAQAARTIVELSVDISTMHTLSNLEEGIELALSLVGKTIAPKAT